MSLFEKYLLFGSLQIATFWLDISMPGLLYTKVQAWLMPKNKDLP